MKKFTAILLTPILAASITACLVSYYKRADGKDIYVEINTKNNGLSNLEITDSLVEALAKSAVYK
ncbi:MAG: hypothetical protein ACI4F6_00820 [Acutalibacteraceae bacterium]